MKNNIFRNQKYIRWLVLVIWLVIWYVAAHLVGSGLILPGPHATLMALLKLVKTKTFYFNVLWTLLRTVIGIAVSFVLGAAFAVLADRSMPVREFLRLPVKPMYVGECRSTLSPLEHVTARADITPPRTPFS